MGRTHSVHAEPTTLGLKLAGWAFELDRGRTRLAAAVDEIGTGKISGPVGTYSHLGPDIEAEVLAALGLHADPVEHPDRPARPARRAARGDRHPRAARWSASQPRSATSSTPRSASSRSRSRPARRARARCPTSATRSCPSGSPGSPGCSAATPARRFEDQPLWHERDISHSSAERVILPDATILLDYMLVRMTGLIEGLVVRSERMRENIDRGLGLHASSRVLVALVEHGGLSREEAYAIVQRAALRAADERAPLRDLLAVDPAVAQRLSLTRARRLLRRRGVPAPRPRGHRPPRRPGAAIAARRGPRPTMRGCPMLADVLPPLRQGPRPVPARRRPARCSSRRTGSARSTSILPTDDPGQGPRADRPVAVLVRRDRHDRRRTTCSTPIRRTSRRRRSETDADGRQERAGPASAARRAARPDDDLPPASVVPIEAVVRGYLAGSGWKDYQASGHVCGIPLPAGPARERPTARADLHALDEGRGRRARPEHRPSTRWSSTSPGARRPGRAELAERVRDEAIALYRYGAAVAERRGIILADTKFEFGTAMTWPSEPARRTAGRADRHPPVPTGRRPDPVEPGSRRRSAHPHRRGHDPGLVAVLGRRGLRARARAGELRQAVRPRLARGQPWDKTAPGPALPDDIVAGTRARYVEAFERITGASFERYLQEDVIAR